ncbi:opioid growth factor receptor [Anguilla rostrata]|uniref:opioid growth factor receptor n=1 Tax=Anguilla rostrata TaxID=7938 RepID=UPI0030D1872F
MEDDLVCEYDSTWDTESDGDDLGENTTRRSSQDKTQKSWGFWSNTSSRNLRAARDMQNYRHGYPNINEEECPEERMTNLKFYLNEITSSPDEVSIEAFHKEWKTDYKRLERVHSYIQWLFPLREPGVNYMASELTKKEIQAFRENDEAKRRLVESYELMLGFYGIQLVNKDTGEVKRAENWRERFANLERNMHNNLRITRILKSLGELGFEHYQAPLVRFFLEETLVRKNLSSVKRSVLDYFLFAVRDKRERRKLIKFAFQNYEPKDKFVWCPRKIQKRLRKKSEKKAEAAGNGESGVPEEGRIKNKAKDSETGSAPKEKKSSDDSSEMQTLTEVEACTDPQRPLLETSVDPESVGSSVDPEALGNGETDPSCITESVLVKSEAEDQLNDGSQTEENAQCQQKLANGKQSEEAAVSEKPAKKKREDVTLKPCSGSVEGLPNGQGHATEVPTADCPDPIDHKQHNSPTSAGSLTTTEGNGNVSSTAGEERAEKQPRTDYCEPSITGKNADMLETADARGKDENKNTDVSIQSHGAMNLENQMSAGAGTNGINLKNNEEPMDTESNCIDTAMDQS